jgi:hypothetical protein
MNSNKEKLRDGAGIPAGPGRCSLKSSFTSEFIVLAHSLRPVESHVVKAQSHSCGARPTTRLSKRWNSRASELSVRVAVAARLARKSRSVEHKAVAAAGMGPRIGIVARRLIVFLQRPMDPGSRSAPSKLDTRRRLAALPRNGSVIARCYVAQKIAAESNRMSRRSAEFLDGAC